MKKRVFMNSRFLAIMLSLTVTLSIFPLVVLATGETACEREYSRTDDIHLAFSSDIHNYGFPTDNNSGAHNLTNWLKNVSDKINDSFDIMGFTGDYGEWGLNEKYYWYFTQVIMDTVNDSSFINAKEHFFVNGNHEYANGNYGSNSVNYPAESAIRDIGEKHVTNCYSLYSFGAASSRQEFTIKDISALDAYLDTVPKSTPVFVLSHYPIHHYSSRTTWNADILVNVLNDHPNVVFLWGHNHSICDPSYDRIFEAGSQLQLTNSLDSKTTIQFTYAASGCMADSAVAAEVKADGLVAKVDDREITLTYYNVDGEIIGQPKTIYIGGEGDVEGDFVNPFIDVKESDYFYDSVRWAVENGITTGTGSTTFSPYTTCTRAQTVTFLWRAAGEPEVKAGSNPFVDVKPGAYYYDAVLWAVENGITTGTSASTFSPDAMVTRGQTVTFLWRAKGSSVGAIVNPFFDVSAGDYYWEAVLWAVENNITTGTSATVFSPNVGCTRSQIVTFLYRDIG